MHDRGVKPATTRPPHLIRYGLLEMANSATAKLKTQEIMLPNVDPDANRRESFKTNNIRLHVALSPPHISHASYCQISHASYGQNIYMIKKHCENCFHSAF
jgi:hypothetical protein